MSMQTELNSNPISQFVLWYELALKKGIKRPDAMSLATATSRGVPSVRVVLYKGLNEKGFLFFTNYQSRKATELKMNPRAAVAFYWPEMEKQIRIEGSVEPIS